MPPRGGHRDAEDTDSDADQVVADQDDALDKAHDHGRTDDELSSDGESDVDASETRRREALEHMARIEKEFAELKDRLYQEKISGLTKEIEQVTNGTHAEFQEQLNSLERKKTEKLRVAQVWHEYQRVCIDNIYRAECEHAENDHMTERQTMREQLLTGLQDKLKRLEEERSSMEITSTARAEANNDAAARAPTTRKQRRRQIDQMDQKMLKRRAVAGPQALPPLKEHEMMEDLLAIRKSMPQLSRRAAQKSAASHGT